MEGVVQRAVKKAIAADYTLAPALLRLFFHDFAVGGVDASVLVDAPGSERYARASKTLRGFDLIDSIKKELEEKCPRTVGVDYWQLAYGRKDGRKSSMVDADQYVPMGRESVTDLVAFCESRWLNVFALVVLSGAHTVGRATCAAVRPRLCGYQGTGKPDAALDARYADFLRRKCRSGGGDDAYVELDAETPTTFDNRYYQNLLHGMGLLETDQKLLPDSRTGEFVRELAAQPSLFSHQFAKSMARIGAVQVLTGNEGEVRLKCSAINGH
uniref:Plant heme peroxidase family profile domain-containing protein n=1 Tax=Oryza brachyantha TaxID=4533 RepID=J3ML33_ORYBR